MRTRLMMVGFCGLLLTLMPAVAYGGPAKTTQVKATPVGLASWYGTPHQGRTTASGERCSRNPLTAAHHAFALGTTVPVTNLRTKQPVVVTINDRGPDASGTRIIDLSEATARRVGIREHGPARVEVVVVGNAS
jgi:rare lipoprotein A